MNMIYIAHIHVCVYMAIYMYALTGLGALVGCGPGHDQTCIHTTVLLLSLEALNRIFARLFASLYP